MKKAKKDLVSLIPERVVNTLLHTLLIPCHCLGRKYFGERGCFFLKEDGRVNSASLISSSWSDFGGLKKEASKKPSRDSSTPYVSRSKFRSCRRYSSCLWLKLTLVRGVSGGVLTSEVLDRRLWPKEP
jgi:hypothetical protein